jgi:hypothetical protein
MVLDGVFGRYLLQSAGLFLLNLGVTAFGHEVLGLPENQAFLISQITASCSKARRLPSSDS